MNFFIKLAAIAMAIRLGALILFILIVMIGVTVKLKDVFELWQFRQRLRKIIKEVKSVWTHS